MTKIKCVTRFQVGGAVFDTEIEARLYLQSLIIETAYEQLHRLFDGDNGKLSDLQHKLYKLDLKTVEQLLELGNSIKTAAEELVQIRRSIQASVETE